MSGVRNLPTMPRLAAALALSAALAGLQACAGAGAPPPGGSAALLPGRVDGVLTSAVDFRPLTPAELASPNVRALVEHCERVGEPYCREKKAPRDLRASFTAGVDQRVVAMFLSTRLRPGAAYLDECRLVDPAGSVVARLPSRAPIVAPPTVKPEGGVTTVCEFQVPARMPAGRWAVEFVVNSQPVRMLWFDVLTGPGAGGVAI